MKHPVRYSKQLGTISASTRQRHAGSPRPPYAPRTERTGTGDVCQQRTLADEIASRRGALTAADLSKYLAVAPVTVFKLAQRGAIPSFRVGSCVRFCPAAIVKCSSRLKKALTPHICALLSQGISVVLDFPGNTKVQRTWFRELIEQANVEHELHFVDASDALCKSQLRDRSKSLPAGSPWTTDADFEAISAYFQPPSEDENFNVVRHERA